jgi:beta-mannosidase
MLVEQRVAVGEALRPGARNVLCVELAPVLERARTGPYEYPPGLVAEGSGFEGLYVRKAPHMFGWDIMPRAVSAGIWRPVHLRQVPRERIDWAWLETMRVDPDGTARLMLHLRARTLERRERYEVAVEGRCGDSRFADRVPLRFEAGEVPLAVPGARRWWPRGRGAADLYDVEASLLRDGEPVDTVRFRHGIRTVALHRTSVTTEAGEGDFRLIVNDEPLFVLGTNWVPLDAFHSRDAGRLPAALEALDDIGCNLVRCWGGNVYESDAFYDACDELGILVWQDFAMACAIYPQDDAFAAELRDEVRAVVRRLRQHPSIAVWAGDNECDQKHVRIGNGRDPNTNILTRTVIPRVLRDEDPTRPYLPSSPYFDEALVRAGERFLPEDHLWGPRDDFYGPFYRESLAHFASEIGYMGAPSVASLRRFLTDGHLWPPTGDPEWLLHATSPFPGIDVHDYRVELMLTQVRSLFGEVPDTLERFVAASQAAQAEAFRTFIERFRAGMWRRTGIIWWNLIDGWPQFSDAVIDYYGDRKPAFEVIRRAQAPVSVIVCPPEGGTHEVVISNLRRDPAVVEVEVADLETGEVLLAATVTAAGDAVTPLGRIAEVPGGSRCLRLRWTVDGRPGWGHHLVGPTPFELDRYLGWMDALRGA